MLAVVLCLSGNRGGFAANFLRGKDRRVVVALGPRHVLADLRDLGETRVNPPVVLTDSIECIQIVHLSSAHVRTPIVFWGDDSEGRARRADVCLPESATLADVAGVLERLTKGLPPPQGGPDTQSRLRRI